MGFDDCYLLGHLVKTHGLKGEFVAHLDVDYPEEYQELESVFVDQNGKLVPFFIESISIRPDKAYIAFEDIENIDQATPLVGSSLYLPVENLPKLTDGKYYFHQLLGMKLFNGKTLVGEVKDVYDLPNNRLLGVDHGGTEILIPLEDQIITFVDIEKGEIYADLPEGLIDVFLEN
ncbi:MAG: 16S rRNA processing protein RimM [Cyclobacteriaceae bacterium]|jgi:16S rRNA processing protein RimM